MASSEPPSGGLARLGHEIRRRNVIPWTLGYAAGGWIVLEATDYFGDLYGWPDVVDRVLPIVLAFGILSTIVLAWFHGAVGWQRVRPREIAIHAGIAALLLTTLGLWGGGAPAGALEDQTPPLTRIAVLYFKNHTPDGLGTAAGDLTESVVHRLARVPALQVLPLTAVERYRVTETPPVAELVEALDVGAFVEGSIAQAGDSVRLNAQLFDAQTRTPLGSWEWAVADGGGSSWVRRIADAVADSVRTRIGGVLERRRAESGATVPEALEAYRRARSILESEVRAAAAEDPRKGLELLEQADHLLKEAESLDPAWLAPVELRIDVAELASRLEGGAGQREPAKLQEAIGHATRGLELGRDSARLLERRGELLYWLASQSEPQAARSLYGEAESDLRGAVRLDPGRAMAWWGLSQMLERAGSFEGAHEHALRALKEDSFLELGPYAVLRLLMVLLQQERVDEAGQLCEEGRRVYPADQLLIQGCLAALISLQKPTDADVAAAWALTEELGRGGVGIAERRPGWIGLGQAATAAVLAQKGDVDSTEHVLRRARHAIEGHSARLRSSGALFEALARHRLGQTDSALHYLAEFVALSPAEAPRLASDWWFRDLWQDPRYQALHSPLTTESGAGR